MTTLLMCMRQSTCLLCNSSAIILRHASPRWSGYSCFTSRRQTKYGYFYSPLTQILSRDSGTFPALLKTLSDPSEDVVKHDLQLLAQISSSSEDSYFRSFMVNVLELFSTDRRLLETRGSLIIRQLCLHLNAEKIFRTLAEILERDDVRVEIWQADPRTSNSLA